METTTLDPPQVLTLERALATLDDVLASVLVQIAGPADA